MKLFLQIGNQQSKSSGAAEVFISRVTEEESKLFQVVQTIAEEVSHAINRLVRESFSELLITVL